MDLSPEIEALQRDVGYLKDRLAIADCIARHARGCDRHDLDLLVSTYWEDGVDEHGAAVNPGPAYAAWANREHAASETNTHHVTTHTCEIDGDTAHVESYVIVVLLAADRSAVQCFSGRYVDRLERRDGEWRIALRRSTVESSFSADASILRSPFFADLGYLKGTRDRDDVSYARPLTLEGDASRW